MPFRGVMNGGVQRGPENILKQLVYGIIPSQPGRLLKIHVGTLAPALNVERDRSWDGFRPFAYSLSDPPRPPLHRGQ